MRFPVDHDYHIHSMLSSCSNDPEQTTERILQYAKENGFSEICLTDHYWDSTVPGACGWYKPQDYDHIAKALPLPQDANVKFLFGCETDMDHFTTVGIPPERFDDFDFIIIPTTHLHMRGFTIAEKDAESDERRAELWVSRLDALLHMELPFGKIGIAHLACYLLNKKSREAYLKTLDLIPTEEMERLFSRAAEVGCGIELNRSDMAFPDDQAEAVLRPFRVAKSCGCKFYLGSDAHHPATFNNAKEIFERAVSLLDLHESDRFYPAKNGNEEIG